MYAHCEYIVSVVSERSIEKEGISQLGESEVAYKKGIFPVYLSESSIKKEGISPAGAP